MRQLSGYSAECSRLHHHRLRVNCQIKKIINKRNANYYPSNIYKQIPSDTDSRILSSRRNSAVKAAPIRKVPTKSADSLTTCNRTPMLIHRSTCGRRVYRPTSPTPAAIIRRTLYAVVPIPPRSNYFPKFR